MDQFDEEIVGRTVGVFDLGIDDKMKPDGLNKQHYPDAVRKIGR